jgi:hypothetical protein
MDSTESATPAQPDPPINASDDLEQAAKTVLSDNDSGQSTMPARGLYPHQWLWDSCFIAIGLANYDVERAKLEILSLLHGQWQNGMLPNIILRPHQVGEPINRQHERIWRSWLNPNAPDAVSTSGITQPPMIAEAVVRIGQHLSPSARRSWYKQVYPALLRYHEWLYSERDPHQEGLVLQIHPWETGLDNTPPWMSELHDHLLPGWIRLIQRCKLDVVIGWFRSDKEFVKMQERMTNIDALAIFDVQRRLRRKNYDFKKYIDHALFVIEDLSFNCIFIRANAHLKTIAESIGKQLPTEFQDSMARGEHALEQLWDDMAEEYFSRDFVSHRLLSTSSIASLMPLYAGCISKKRAARLVSLLEQEHRFGPAYPVPSVPLDSPWFQPKRYWQGPTWVNTNWLLIDGLVRYGYHDHAAALQESTIEMVERSGFHEYFNPIDGSGYGSDRFSWTAALIIDMINHPLG